MDMASLDHIGALWWDAILIAALKASVILALAGLLVWTMRRRSPSVRFQVWLGGFLSAALLPLASAVAPALPWLPSWLGADSWFTPAAVTPTSMVGAAGWLASAALAVAIAVWFAGAAYHAGRALLAAILLRQIAVSSRRLPEEHPLTELCRELQARQGVRTNVDLFVASGEARPLAWGISQARLLLPESAAQWPPLRATAVLIHELEHIRRRDAWVQVLEQVVCSLYWFHPLVWWASARMRYEREAACDDAVLSAGVLPTDYAESLLALSHPNSQAWQAPVLAAPMAETRALTRRIREILSATRIRSRLPVLQGSAAVSGFAAALLLLSSLTPAPTPAAPEPVVAAEAAQPAETLLPPAGHLADSTPMSRGRSTFDARVRLPLDASFQPERWDASAELVGPVAGDEAAEDGADPLEDMEGWPEPRGRDPAFSLDEIAPDVKVKSPMRRSPTDTRGRVSQALTPGSPMPL